MVKNVSTSDSLKNNISSRTNKIRTAGLGGYSEEKDLTYGMAKKSVNWKQSLVMTQIAKEVYARQYVERYHRTATCALSMKDLISKFLL
jgi:hypothetical protein